MTTPAYTFAETPDPLTSTTAQDALEARNVLSAAPRGFTVVEALDEPGGRELPYRFITLEDPEASLGLAFRLDRDQAGVSVLGYRKGADALNQWAETLGTFETMPMALDAVLAVIKPLTTPYALMAA